MCFKKTISCINEIRHIFKQILGHYKKRFNKVLVFLYSIFLEQNIAVRNETSHIMGFNNVDKIKLMVTRYLKFYVVINEQSYLYSLGLFFVVVVAVQLNYFL